MEVAVEKLTKLVKHLLFEHIVMACESLGEEIAFSSATLWIEKDSVCPESRFRTAIDVTRGVDPSSVS